MPTKIGIKFCRFASECVLFVHAHSYVPTQLKYICIANVAFRVSSQQFLS